MNANRDAQACAQEILTADKTNHEQMLAFIRRYISIRYFLDEDEMCTNNLYELAETAVAKTLSIKREKLADIDIPGTCTGASSAISKKTLLLMAFRRDLGIDLDPEQAANIQTTDQLAQHIEWALGKHPVAQEE